MVCKKCKTDVPKGNKFCTSCGTKIKKPFYNRVSFWVIVIIAGIFFIGSLGDNNSPSSETNAQNNSKNKEIVENKITEKTTEIKDKYAIGEIAHLRGMDLQIAEVKKITGDEWHKPKDGHVFIVVDILMKNSSDKSLSYNTLDFKIQNSNGQITNGLTTFANNENPLNSGELVSGGIVRGTLAFEQPKEDTSLQLIYNNNMFSDKEIKIDLANKLEDFVLLEGEEIKFSEDIPKIGEPLELDGMKVIVTNISKSSGDNISKPDDGNEYVIVSVEINNISDTTKSYNSFNFKVQNSKGNIKDQAFTTLVNDTALSSGELAAGGKVSGDIAFEQLKNDNLVLIYEPNVISGKQGQILLK